MLQTNRKVASGSEETTYLTINVRKDSRMARMNMGQWQLTAPNILSVLKLLALCVYQNSISLGRVEGRGFNVQVSKP
jgi:hypothetical protein